jgi:hypothetical protein
MAEVRCWSLIVSRVLCRLAILSRVTLLSQACSLVALLNHLRTMGTIKLTKDPSIHPQASPASMLLIQTHLEGEFKLQSIICPTPFFSVQ